MVTDLIRGHNTHLRDMVAEILLGSDHNELFKYSGLGTDLAPVQAVSFTFLGVKTDRIEPSFLGLKTTISSWTASQNIGLSN
jgi:hypothetical protein